MKIKRYTANSMRAALAQVRAEQGVDAVILSSRRGEDGIEVIAAVDYDEALFIDANRPRLTPSPLVAAPLAAAASIAPAVPIARTAPAVVPKAVPKTATPSVVATKMIAPKSTPGYDAMQRELQDLRRLLETGLAGMAWSDKRLREPLQSRVLEELSALDIAPDVAMALAALTPRRTSLQNPSHIPLALLVKHLPVINDLTCITGGITAVVGPTGAGKTTTIAKLAARWCMQHGSQDLALVSTDGYRIGAREQLMTFARILGAPMHAANSGKELAGVLDRLKSKKLILIDTAGMGPRDVRLSEQLAALKLGAARARVLLALPAQGEGHALEEIVRAFARVIPTACILTKVDEAASLGAVISVVLRHRLKIAYVCDGQRVPEDLHAAHQRRISLIRAALQLKEGVPRPRETALARSFGRVPAHA
jgi:flagellar biosynthesis protein FlhF